MNKNQKVQSQLNGEEIAEFMAMNSMNWSYFGNDSQKKWFIAPLKLQCNVKIGTAHKLWLRVRIPVDTNSPDPRLHPSCSVHTCIFRQSSGGKIVFWASVVGKDNILKIELYNFKDFLFKLNDKR